MKISRRIFFAVFAAAIFCAAAAHAENGLPRPFAPWMALEDTLQSPLPAPQEAGIRPRPPRRMETEPRTTDVPLITPEDTLELIEQIYGGDAQPQRQSALEQAYAHRTIEPLEQFGYALFSPSEKSEKEEAKSDFTLPAGAAQDDFLLNIGDRLDIAFRGQRQDRKTYAIGSDGTLLIDDLPPVAAAGMTIGQLREALRAETSKLHNTDAFVSLESVRQAGILLAGHVRKPGRQNLTAFHTVIDALIAAGGIEKTGSLRQVRLVRGGRSTIIDLYSLLVHGSPIMDIGLRDGDRIIVPPVGPTVAVAGAVKRPGIYEILPDLTGVAASLGGNDGQSLALEDVLALAGGTLGPGQNRFLKLGMTGDGRETVEEIKNRQRPAFGDGSILMVNASKEERTGTVELIGHTRRPGIHALSEAPSLSALLDSERIFGPDAYPLIGVIERRDESQLAPQMIAFPPLQALRGAFDRTLRDGDTVRLFSRTQILAMQKERQDAAEFRLASYGSAAVAPEEDILNDPVLLSFLKERSAFIRGAVRQEGAWPVAEGATLDNLIAAAGGLTLEAGTSDIEVTSRLQGEGGQANGRSGTQRITVDFKKTDPSSVLIGPGDSVRVNPKFRRVRDNSVLIIGEVERPGRYDLMPGDKMSDLLARAGGLTPQSYAQGAIFSRESERRAEEARFRAQAQELELRLAAALNQGKEDKNGPDPSKIAAVQELVTQLRNAEAVGRITVEADPGALAAQPELDILLESGDRIYIPARPLTVRVSGEILSPASLQFRKDKDARAYIAEAGGFTYDADKDRVFVLYPDGSAQPLTVGPWNHTPVFIPPGSTLVVPRDPKPFDFIQTARDVSQILSNLAITGIFLDDIRSGD